MSETLRPRGQRVLVKEHDSLNVETKSGIVVQLNEAKRLCSGTVLAVGQHCPDIEVGDTVHYRRECGRPWRDKVVLNYEFIEAVGEGDVQSL